MHVFRQLYRACVTVDTKNCISFWCSYAFPVCIIQYIGGFLQIVYIVLNPLDLLHSCHFKEFVHAGKIQVLICVNNKFFLSHSEQDTG